MQFYSINEVDACSSGESGGGVRESAGRYENSPARPVCGDHAFELPYYIDADLHRLPLLELHVVPRSALHEHEVEAIISTTSSSFDDLVPTASISLADQHLELFPSHTVEGCRLGAFSHGQKKFANVDDAEMRRYRNLSNTAPAGGTDPMPQRFA